MKPDKTGTVLVCHSNKAMVQLAKLEASRHGITVVVARDGADLILRSRQDPRPDAIVLSNDLKNPSTDEIVKALHADPRLRGVNVVVMKGVLGSLGGLLKSFKFPPQIPRV